GGDRLVVTEKVGYTPTANSGTFPTNPPLSYRNIEFFTVDQLPTLSDDAATTPEDTAVVIDVLSNDTGVGDAPLTVTIANPPTHGTVAAFGPTAVALTYVPNPQSAGIDHLSFVVTDDSPAGGPALTSSPGTSTITVQGHNDPPVAFPQNLTTAEDSALPFTLTG